METDDFMGIDEHIAALRAVTRQIVFFSPLSLRWNSPVSGDLRYRSEDSTETI